MLRIVRLLEGLSMHPFPLKYLGSLCPRLAMYVLYTRIEYNFNYVILTRSTLRFNSSHCNWWVRFLALHLLGRHNCLHSWHVTRLLFIFLFKKPKQSVSITIHNHVSPHRVIPLHSVTQYYADFYTLFSQIIKYFILLFNWLNLSIM